MCSFLWPWLKLLNINRFPVSTIFAHWGQKVKHFNVFLLNISPLHLRVKWRGGKKKEKKTTTSIHIAYVNVAFFVSIIPTVSTGAKMCVFLKNGLLPGVEWLLFVFLLLHIWQLWIEGRFCTMCSKRCCRFQYLYSAVLFLFIWFYFQTIELLCIHYHYLK